MPYSSPHAEHHSHFSGSVFWGGVTLAFVAGYVNTIMLDVYHVAVSHMSGAISKLGIDLGQANFGEFKMLLAIILAFYFGSMLSGIIIGTQYLKPGKRYGLVMVVEGLFLFQVSQLIALQSRFSVPLAALACGMQNAMASSYFGLNIRTTHMTGILTDLGFLTGSLLRPHHDKKPKFWKFILLTLILLGFFLGGVCAVFAKLQFGTVRALGAIAVALVIGGGNYFFWNWRFGGRSSPV